MHKLYLFTLLACLSIPLLGQKNYQVSFNSSQPALLIALASAEGETSNNPYLGAAPTASGGVEPYQYYWTPEDLLDDPTIANPTYYGFADQLFYLVTTDSRGCTASDSVFVDLLLTQLVDIVQDAQLFPNPSSQKVDLLIKDLEMGSVVTIHVLDSKGVQVKSVNQMKTEKHVQLNISDLSSGVYLLKIVTGDKQYTKSLLVK